MSVPSEPRGPAASRRIPPREAVLLAALGAVQFLHIVDFVIVMPLGPRLMRDMQVGAAEFGWIVSAYTFSAGAAGLLAALYLDRFDRRSVLLVLLAGFAVGTLLCAVAPGYASLVAARVVAGAFGGVMNAVVFSIIGDEVPAERRGTATGVVMAGFSAASVLGLPLGLALANRWGWHAPFVALTAATAVVAVGVVARLAPMRGHLVPDRVHRPVHDLARVVAEPVHLRAFGVTLSLVFAGFMVFPYLSPYLVGNVGLREEDLAYVYLVGGLATLVSGPLAGRWADRHGHTRGFYAAALGSLVPLLLVTRLPAVPLPAVLAATTLLMVLMSARLVPALALINEKVAPALRGSFMSVNSAVQQLAAGVAASVAGLMVHGAAGGGALQGFPRVGLAAAAATLASVAMVRRLAARPASSAAPSAAFPEPVPAVGGPGAEP